MALSRQARGTGNVVEQRYIKACAVPSNKRMELTVKSVTPFARAKRGPLFPAAHAWRPVASKISMQTKLVRRFILCLGVILLFAGSGNAQEPKPRLPSQPQPITKKLPSYPPIARAACAQGSVAVLVEIDTTGKVTATDVLYGHPLLRRVAEASAHAWTFDASKEELGQRREVIRFVFQILPFEVSEKKLKPVWATAMDVEIRVHPSEPSCDDCTENRRRELRRGGCPRNLE